jgi:hypothetical protein
MSVKKTFLIAAMAIAVCACEKENKVEAYVPAPGEIQLNMIYPGTQTRVTDAGFDANDQIGVYVTSNDEPLQLAGNEVNNELFSFNGTSWTSARKVYWNEGAHNLYAYYPYSSSVNDVVDYSFRVQTDQSTPEAYSQSDFLWASATEVAASSEPVPMLFEHKMSKVVVKLEKGENFSGAIPSAAEVYILSTVPQAVVDLSTGDAARDNFASTESIKCMKMDEGVYSAIVVPQSLTSRRPLVEVIVGPVSYLMEGKISFRQGYQHTLTVTLNQNPDQIKIEIGGGVDPWN